MVQSEQNKPLCLATIVSLRAERTAASNTGPCHKMTPIPPVICSLFRSNPRRQEEMKQASSQKRKQHCKIDSRASGKFTRSTFPFCLLPRVTVSLVFKLTASREGGSPPRLPHRLTTNDSFLNDDPDVDTKSGYLYTRETQKVVNNTNTRHLVTSEERSI